MNTWQCCGELVLLLHILTSFYTFLSKYMCYLQCLCRILFIFRQDKEVQCFEDTNKPKQCFHQSICSLGMDEDLEDNLLGPERSEEAKAA